jgi:hypothetical protein
MRRSIILIAAVLAFGCVERAPELSPADRERLREYVSTQAPTPEHPLEIEFANGVRLIGYDVEPDAVQLNQEFTITWHWHAREDLDDGWQIFTHVAKTNGENALNQDGVGIIRELYQPGRWEAGQYIRDRQTVTLPADWNDTQAIFYLGLWNGPHRLEIRRGPDDGDNRVRAASLTIGAAGAQGAQGAEGAQPAEGVQAQRQPAPVLPPPSTIAVRADGEITIDGDLTEASWQAAPRTQAFVNTVDGSNADIRASARVLWDDRNMYVAFEVADRFVSNTITERDGHLWEQDAVEIMLDPDGDEANYFEIQVSPTNVVFDTRYDTRRQPQPFGDVAWNSRLTAAVHVRGTANDEAADQGYIAEIAIPWQAFRAGRPAAVRPDAGGNWRMNFYVMDKRQGGAMGSAGWSPTHERDFHVPSRFGTVTFQGEQQAAAEPVAEPAAEEAAEPGAAQQPAAIPAAGRTLRLPPRAMQALRERLRAPEAPRPNQVPAGSIAN